MDFRAFVAFAGDARLQRFLKTGHLGSYRVFPDRQIRYDVKAAGIRGGRALIVATFIDDGDGGARNDG